MSDKLRHCPFCGNSAIIVEIGGGAAFQVKCRNILECGAETERFDTAEEATDAWNRRAPSEHIVDANKKADDNPPLTLEELREMDGEPVWIVETPDWGHWELSENAEDYFDGRDADFYGMTMPPSLPDPMGRYGLHIMGWLTYRRKPEEAAAERVHAANTQAAEQMGGGV